MKLILHIGTDKTGTSTLQRFLYENRAALRDQGFLYPESLTFGAVQPACRKLPFIANAPDYVDDFIRAYGLTNPRRRHQARARYCSAFDRDLKRASDCETTIISSEHLWTRLRTQDDLDRLREVVAPRFQEVTIIVYLREQTDYAVSRYSTAVKSGGTARSIPRPDQLRANYNDLLAFWADGFPFDRFEVRLFEPTALVGGDIVRDFAQSAGIRLDKLKLPDKRNESLDRLGLEILRRVNKYIPRFVGDRPNPARANLVSYFNRHCITGDRLQPTPAQRRVYERFFHDSNDAVRRRYFPERHSLFTVPSHVDFPVEPQVNDADIDALAGLIADLWLDGRSARSRARSLFRPLKQLCAPVARRLFRP